MKLYTQKQVKELLEAQRGLCHPKLGRIVASSNPVLTTNC